MCSCCASTLHHFSLTPQAGLVSFSSGATIEFGLNVHQDLQSLQEALDKVRYTGGKTATALALRLARQMMDPGRQYGARPFSEGVPRIAVLVTDGRSNVFSISKAAPALRDFGVQVSCFCCCTLVTPLFYVVSFTLTFLHCCARCCFN